MYSTAALLLDEKPGAFSRDGETVTVRVAGNALEALDVRDGDRVVVAKGREAEFGDLAALCVAGGAPTLWKTYPEAEGPEAEGPEAEGPEAEGPEAEGPEAEGPEGDASSGGRLHLSNGRGRWTVPAKNVEVIGVVIAVLRKFGGGP